jgi:hypothetical protein
MRIRGAVWQDFTSIDLAPRRGRSVGARRLRCLHSIASEGPPSAAESVKVSPGMFRVSSTFALGVIAVIGYRCHMNNRVTNEPSLGGPRRVKARGVSFFAKGASV